MANEEQNVNREWGFDINLSGVTAGGSVNKNVPTGYYSAKVEDMYELPDKPGRIAIKLMVTEGEYAGAIRTDWISAPKSADDKVRYYWRCLAESVGYTAAQLDAGGVRFTRDTFLGKVGGIHYAAKNEAAGQQYERITYLTPTEFTAKKSAGNGSALGSAPVTNGAAAPALGASTTKGDVFAKLGL
jgi:hypothetical protein